MWLVVLILHWCIREEVGEGLILKIVCDVPCPVATAGGPERMPKPSMATDEFGMVHFDRDHAFPIFQYASVTTAIPSQVRVDSFGDTARIVRDPVFQPAFGVHDLIAPGCPRVLQSIRIVQDLDRVQDDTLEPRTAHQSPKGRPEEPSP